MKFAKRMDQFGEGIFSTLLEMKKKRLSEGKPVIDLSVGAPNIPPAPILYMLFWRRRRSRKIMYMPYRICRSFGRRRLCGRGAVTR